MKVIAIDDSKTNHVRLIITESGVYKIQKCNPIWKTIAEHNEIEKAVFDFLHHYDKATIKGGKIEQNEDI